MAKRKLDSINPSLSTPKPAKKAKVEILELEDFGANPDAAPVFTATGSAANGAFRPRRHWVLAGFGLAVTLVLLYVMSFEIAHVNKIYPGVVADGVALGGLSQDEAAKALAKRAAIYSGQVITITQGNTNLRIPVTSLDPTYSAARAAELAYTYGRQGHAIDQIHAQARSALGRTTVITTMKYDQARLGPYLTSLLEDIITPVRNAQLAFNDNQAQVTPAQPGNRLDMGMLAGAITDRLSRLSTDPITAPVYQIAPTLNTAPLRAAIPQINSYVASPITLNYNGTSRQIDQPTIISWINVSARSVKPFTISLKLEDLYPLPVTADLGLSRDAIAAYVANLASGLDQTPQNAALAMQDGVLTVVQASRTGVKLDQAATTAAINDLLKQSSGTRSIDLKLATTQADVNENNLESLGIKELISEGETYFPGSPSTRLTNVRTGARRFNGVLLKPGETFSFGKLLGDVGPEQGYVPELVILNNHEEKQYGGGLCQVSSTAFRAALNAGLPITERHNHAFAISYYTWPHAAPGVDATIYYPDVDFKFVNDTGHYILMQTIMSGYDLKFQYFGTKTKTGVIRGPNFVSGSSDATQPSHTVFYRDVLDLAGKVIKTDTFHTWYKSSKDFPITQQYN